MQEGGHWGKFLLHAPAAVAAYRDKWAARLVRTGRSCLFPPVPVAILLSLPNLLRESNGRKNPLGGQGLKEVELTATKMMAMAEVMATAGWRDKE